MKSISRLRSIGFLISSAVLLFVSCTKINEATNLGDDLIPAVDNVTTFETFLDVETDNFLLDDSTKIGRTDQMAIGVLDDPLFGSTKAEAYFTISSSVYNAYPFRNRDSVTIDSVIFTAGFSQVYGDTNSIQDFQVFEIAQSAAFDTGGLYYPISNPDFTTAGSLSSVTSIDFRTLNDPKRIVRIAGRDTITVENQLRIPLFNSVGDRFKNYDTLPGNNAYKNDSLFRTFFKGMAIKAQGGDNRALAYIELDDQEKTGVEFYCRVEKSDGKFDTIVVKFGVVNSIAANLVKRTSLHPDFASNLSASGPPAINRQNLYIQSSPGSYATVRIKGLDTMDNKVIHRAELQIRSVNTDENIYQRPRLLFLDAIDSSRNVPRTIPFDFIFNQGTYNIQTFGGIFRFDKTFFNITRYAQHILTNDTALHTLRLYAPFETKPWFSTLGAPPYDPYSPFFPSLIVNTPIAYGRVIVGGGAHPDPAKRMRVRVVYSKI